MSNLGHLTTDGLVKHYLDLSKLDRCVCLHMKGKHHRDGCGDFDIDPRLPDPKILCLCPEYTEMPQ